MNVLDCPDCVFIDPESSPAFFTLSWASAMDATESVITYGY